MLPARSLLAVLACAVLGGCAVGAETAPPRADSGLHPHLAPQHRSHSGQLRHHDATGHPRRHGPAAGAPRADSHRGRQAPGHPTSTGTPSPADQTGPDSAAAGPATVRVDDAQGDVHGLSAPDFSDLTGASLTRDARGYRLQVETGGALPAASTDHTMHVIGFVDTDRDGQIDYELWATLADNGWNAAWRTPDGAHFGSAAGIRIAVSGSRLTMTFAADHVGGTGSFRWLVGAEYGTDAQMASGTQTSDYVPDRGGAPSP